MIFEHAEIQQVVSTRSHVDIHFVVKGMESWEQPIVLSISLNPRAVHVHASGIGAGKLSTEQLSANGIDILLPPRDA